MIYYNIVNVFFVRKRTSVICSKQMFVRKKLKKKCMQRTDIFYFYYLNCCLIVVSEHNNNINVYRKMTEYMFVILRW